MRFVCHTWPAVSRVKRWRRVRVCCVVRSIGLPALVHTHRLRILSHPMPCPAAFTKPDEPDGRHADARLTQSDFPAVLPGSNRRLQLLQALVNCIT